MNNNIKIKIAKILLKDAQEEREMWNERLLLADKEFIGKTLTNRLNQLYEWRDTATVEVEALTEYIKNIEDFNTLDAEQTKAEELENEKI